MRADVTIYDISNDRLAELDMFFSSQIKTAYASKAAIASAVKNAHLVIGAVLVPGAAAPKLVTRDMIKTMKRGAVMVDIAIDQGGCFETSHATTHEDPVFELANMGAEAAMKADAHLANGLNVYHGKITHHAVAEALNMPFTGWNG
ncbi:hypothetical protein WR25_18631 [Diploscapter pachys]|uniref:Alanine dehydrogenase/pyridine nucleotide transhydrogenase NAD(H)-binding domain-containing protein n=1 Tax=Diploscapter pachys TaxID=2018661 RepID=A0A2A2KAB6_9BILA|nr:hypothetical protein WR25_18631 [Diploscapter pachys]